MAFVDKTEMYGRYYKLRKLLLNAKYGEGEYAGLDAFFIWSLEDPSNTADKLLSLIGSGNTHKTDAFYVNIKNIKRRKPADKLGEDKARYFFIPPKPRPSSSKKKYIIGGSIAVASLVAITVAYRYAQKRPKAA